MSIYLRNRSTIPSAITDFESSFVSPFKDKAAKDQLVHNPYYYVLKGNDHLVLGVLYDAISCYNRSISMDPTFSVNARYNKAQALLLYEKNAGQRQQVALQELKKAKEIIVGTYKPALMTFNALIAQNGCKMKTSQHVQHQLNILSEQENYVVKACDIIEKAQIKKHHVKLTPKTLKESFEQAEEKHDKAIREATVNGLTNFFTVEEVIPTPWWSIISVALIGLAQMAAGFLIVACTAGSLGLGLISEGISDLITAVKYSITGSFSWAAWATQKAVSLLVSLISAGYGALKSGWQSVTNTVKDLVGKTAVGISKDGIKLAGKEVAVALGKGAAKELLMTAGQFCTNKLFMEDLEKEIAERVGKALTDSLLTNPLVVDALQSDQKNGNSCWQQLFINEGLSLLKDQKEHKCLEMLRDISLGVAKNTIPLCGAFLQVAGVGKMLYELNNYTDDFIAKFNARVSSHQNDIIAAKNSAATKQAHREHIQAQETVTSAAPPIDLEEGDVSVHTLEEGTTYRSKIDEEKTQLQSTYNNLGPSTPSSLANQFKIQIANKLTGSIKTNLVNPSLTYASTSMTNKFFKETDKSIAILKHKVKTDRDCRHNSNEVANAANNRIQAASKSKEGAESKNAKKTAEKKKVPLDESAASAIARAKNGEIKDGTDLGVLSNVAEAPIHVYGEDGKLKYVVGDALPGEPILLKHTAPTADNPHGHFAPMNSNIQVAPSGSSNCALDAILPQLSASKRAELKDVNGLQEKMIEVIRDNPKASNAAYKSRDALAVIAPDKIISGGWVLHALDPNFWEAHLSGNKEEAQAIIDKWTNREIIGGKIIAITATGIVVTAVTGGTGFLPYFAGISAATTVSIGLDEQIRNTLIAGNYLNAADQATYHFPFFGSGRNMHNAYKASDKGKFFFHLGMLGVEGFGLRHAAKSGARTVASAEKALESVQKTGNAGGNTGKVVLEKIKYLPTVRTKLSTHCLERCAERGITKTMAEKAIEKGVRYYDPKNESITYVLHNAMGSGKHLVVAVNPLSGKLNTVYTSRPNYFPKRFMPID